jgi:hypothetical protein
MFMKKFIVLSCLLLGSLSEAYMPAYKKYKRDERAMQEGRRPRPTKEQSIEQQQQQIVDDVEERACALLIKADAPQDSSGSQEKPAAQQKSGE